MKTSTKESRRAALQKWRHSLKGQLWYKKTRKKRLLKSKLWYLENKQRANASSRAWVLKNKESVAKRLKKWAKNNSDYLRAYRKIWRNANRSKMRAHRDAWILRNPDKNKSAKNKWQNRNRKYHNLYSRFWRMENRDKCCDYAHRRRSKKISAPVRLEGVPELYEFFRSCVHIRCFYCRRWVAGRDVHVDHKIPLTRGGRHAADNLCASCPRCNLTKSDKLISEWRPELANLT